MSRRTVSHDDNSHIPPRQTDHRQTAERFYQGYSTFLRKYATKLANSKKKTTPSRRMRSRAYMFNTIWRIMAALSIRKHHVSV